MDFYTPPTAHMLASRSYQDDATAIAPPAHFDAKPCCQKVQKQRSHIDEEQELSHIAKRRRLWQSEDDFGARSGNRRQPVIVVPNRKDQPAIRSVSQALRRREIMSTAAGRAPAIPYRAAFENLHNDAEQTFHFPGAANGNPPAFAVAFHRQLRNGHILASADEDGHVMVVDTSKRHRLPPVGAHPNTPREGVEIIPAHRNAIFDVAWSDHQPMLGTAAGDTTVKLVNVETKDMIVFKGHQLSVKCIRFRKDDLHVFASAGRDGNILLWDVRNAGSFTNDGFHHKPAKTISNAHAVDIAKRKGKRTARIPQDIPQSVTAVAFLNNSHLLASAGAADGVIKIWDTRKTYTNSKGGSLPLLTMQHPAHAQRKRGFTSLSVSSDGSKLLASCTDDSLYEYDTINASSPVVKAYRGHSCNSFYVKAMYSPDDRYVISGSSDQKAYIWEANRPDDPLCILNGHTMEVTSGAWSHGDPGTVATCSDDASVRVWTIDPAVDRRSSGDDMGRRHYSAVTYRGNVPNNAPATRKYTTDALSSSSQPNTPALVRDMVQMEDTMSPITITTPRIQEAQRAIPLATPILSSPMPPTQTDSKHRQSAMRRGLPASNTRPATPDLPGPSAQGIKQATPLRTQHRHTSGFVSTPLHEVVNDSRIHVNENGVLIPAGQRGPMRSKENVRLVDRDIRSYWKYPTGKTSIIAQKTFITAPALSTECNLHEDDSLPPGETDPATNLVTLNLSMDPDKACIMNYN